MSLSGVTLAIDNTKLTITSLKGNVFIYSKTDKPLVTILQQQAEATKEVSNAWGFIEFSMWKFRSSQKSEDFLKKASENSGYTVDNFLTKYVVHYNIMNRESNVSKYDYEKNIVTELGPCKEEVACLISDAVQSAMGPKCVSSCKLYHITEFDFTLNAPFVPVVGADAGADAAGE
jgi:hypothetical protein